MSDRTIYVGICFDERLLTAAFVLLASIKAHARPERPVTVFAVTSFPSVDLEDLVRAMASPAFMLVPVEATSLPPNLPIRDHITAGTYLRFLLPDLLPDVQRILYLDIDIVVNHEIETLFDVDLKSSALAAMPDHSMLSGSRTWPTFFIPFEGRRYRFAAYAEQVLELPCPTSLEYFNCGVLVLDLDRWRRDRIAARTLDYLASNNNLYLMDQDALNHVIGGRAVAIDARWNCFAKNAAPLSMGDRLFRLTNAGRSWEKVRTQWRLDPWIVHYAGANKPWAPREPATPQDFIWWHYAMLSPKRDRVLAEYRSAEQGTRPRDRKMPHLAETGRTI